jgi:hypothetical protein
VIWRNAGSEHALHLLAASGAISIISNRSRP